MEYQRLGKSNLKVSRIGMGCWAIGGKKWGPVDDQQSLAAVKAAIEEGVNFFDTADYYGLGHSEEILGKALRKHRQKVVIATKVGLKWNKKGKVRPDLSPSYIFKACEESLKRLQTGWIDLYQIHWPDSQTPSEETLAALEKLVSQGKVYYFGGGNLSQKLLEKAAKSPFFVSYQAPFNLFNQEAKRELIPWLKKKEIGFIGYEPLFKGILTGKFKTFPNFPKGDQRKWDSRFRPEQFPIYQKKVAKLTEIAKKYGMTCTQLSLSLLLKDSSVTTVIPGAKTKEQVRKNAQAIKFLRKRNLSKIAAEVATAIQS